jgi:hypothetical protein
MICSYICKNIRDKVILLIFYNNISWRGFTYIVKFLERKDKKSYIQIQHKGFIKQYFRFMKYCYFSVVTKKINKSGSLNLSLPYFTKDLAKMPEDTISTRGLGISLYECFLLLIRSIVLLLIMPFLHINNKSNIYGSLMIALLYYISIRSSKLSRVNFYYYSFVPEVVPFLFFIKNNPDIKCHYYEYMSFIDETNDILCDVLHHPNEMSSQFSQNNNDIFVASEYRYKLSKRHFLSLAKEADKKKKSLKAINIGIYTSGWYLRNSHGYLSSELVKSGVQSERNMFELLVRFADLRPDINFIIYIHIARGVESYDEATNYYKDILKTPNIKLMDSSCKSSDDFDKVNLGVTVQSNIFWDRLNIGLKTILIDPVMGLDFILQSGLKHVTCSTKSKNCIKELEDLVFMDNYKFMNRVVN